MNRLIERLPAPDWLMRQTARAMQDEPFPLLEILKDSLYYAGAGMDGAPVKHFGGNIHSFVYTDYLVRKHNLLDKLSSRHGGFVGFSIVGIREIPLQDVFPRGLCRTADLDPRLFINERGRPDDFLHHDPPRPYALWIVFERQVGRDPETRPARFSLLHICCESIAGYIGLYTHNGILPRMLYLINHGYGGNWTDFEDEKRLYARTVASHPLGLPLYLAGRRNYVPLHQPESRTARSRWSHLYPGPPLGEVWPDGFEIWKRRSTADDTNEKGDAS